MILDEKVKRILIEKLRFTPIQISRLENDSDLLPKLLGYLKILKRSANTLESKQAAMGQVKKIRHILRMSDSPIRELLRLARSEYYTFQKG